MSPTSFVPGISAWKSRPIRSGAGFAFLSAPGQRPPPAAMGSLNTVLAHQAGDPLAVHAPPQTPQFGMDARDAVGLA
ncbi:hypothetical protein O1M63_18415 [Streptomyces mirabilis]|nr:hypothetical protein [Streptomyces mirabilis]